MCDYLRWEKTGNPDPPYMYLYQNANCTGNSVSQSMFSSSVNGKSNLDDTSLKKNQQSSMYVPAAYKLSLYKDQDFKGQTYTIKGPKVVSDWKQDNINNYFPKDEADSYKLSWNLDYASPIDGLNYWDAYRARCCLGLNSKDNCNNAYSPSTVTCNKFMEDTYYKDKSPWILKNYYNDSKHKLYYKNLLKNIFQNEIKDNYSIRTECCKGNTTFGSDLCGPYWGPSHDGSCDDVYKYALCSVDKWKTEPKCGCLLPSSEYNEFVRSVGPECIDERCRAPGVWQTKAQREKSCNIVDCRQILDISAEGGSLVNIDSVQFEQKCGMKPNAYIEQQNALDEQKQAELEAQKELDAQKQKELEDQIKNDLTDNESNSNTMLYIIIIIIVIFILLLSVISILIYFL